MSETIHHDPIGEERNPARWVVLVLLALLALLPPETRGESLAAAAALVAVLAACAWRAGSRSREQLLLVVAAALAIPLIRFALAPGAAVWPIALAGIAAGAGISVAALRRPRALGEPIGRVLAVAGGLVSLHALYQRLWGLERLAERVAAEPGLPDREAMLIRLTQGRAFAAFSTPAAMGGFLALALPVTVVLVARARGPWRLIWCAALLLQLGGMLAASSATATVALLGALVLATLLWRVGGKAAWAALALALVLLATVAALRGSEVLTASHPNSPWRLRAGNYVAAWSMTRDHLWTGVGPGGFAESYPAYRQPGDNETRHAHSLPLELGAELGIPAGAAVSVAFFVLFIGPLARARRNKDPWSRAMALGLASFALHNLADFTAFLPSLLWTAAILRGAVAPPEEAVHEPPAGAVDRALAGASLAALLAAVLVAIGTGVADMARMESRFAAYRGDAGRAEEQARRAATWAPWSPEAALLHARTTTLGIRDPRADAERLEAAVERAERAVNLSPVRPAARELRARLRLLSGDFPGAYADMVAASKLYPHNEKYARARDELEAGAREAIERAGEVP